MVEGRKLRPMMIRALSLVAASALLAGCQSNRYAEPAYPQSGYGDPMPPAFPAPQPIPPGPDSSDGSGDRSVTYRATGTEPFWKLDIGRNLSFFDPDSGITVAEPTPQPSATIGGQSYITPRIRVSIVNAPCNDGTSERDYPDVVKVNVDGRDFHGCGAEIGMYRWTAERAEGSDPYARPDAELLRGNGQIYEAANSSWEIVRVDGRKVPPGYRIDFGLDRLQAKLGCNDLAATFEQQADRIIAGPVFSTKQSCVIIGDEEIAKRMMASPMLFTVRDKAMVLLNSAGTLELKRIRD